MTWILTAISLIGNYLNCRKIRAGFILWLICNTGWFVFDLVKGTYSRAVLDIVQSAFCIYGLKKWGEKPQ